MTEMVKRVARAHYEAYFEGVLGCCEQAWDEVDEPRRGQFMGAAIAAMREPTQAMVNAGADEVGPKDERYETEWLAARDGWREMIDAALQEDRL